MYDQASYSTETANANKQIIAGGTYTTRKVTIASGNLVAGAVLGAVLDAAAATATAGTPFSGTGATVGNGTVSAVTTADGAMPGEWQLECTATGATGKFKVVRPDGTVEGIATIGSAYDGELKLTIADGSNDWLVGDIIPVTVTYDEDELEYVLSESDATDGSQTPALVLAHDCDASSASAEAIAYETGQLVSSGLTLGDGHTIASIREGLRDKGLVIDD